MKPILDFILGLLDMAPAKLLRLALLLMVIVGCSVPGAIILLFYGINSLGAVNLLQLSLMAVAISIPLYFLGVITFVHPYATICELSEKPKSEAVALVIIASSVWAVLDAIIISVMVYLGSHIKEQILPSDKMLAFGGLYLFFGSIFGCILYINTGRYLRRNSSRTSR